MKMLKKIKERHGEKNSWSRVIAQFAIWSGFTVIAAVAIAYYSNDLIPQAIQYKKGEFLERLLKISSIFQGTLAIGASVAAALVTAYFAKTAVEIAKASIEITKGEFRRESEKYGRELITEIRSTTLQFETCFLELARLRQPRHGTTIFSAIKIIENYKEYCPSPDRQEAWLQEKLVLLLTDGMSGGYKPTDKPELDHDDYWKMHENKTALDKVNEKIKNNGTLSIYDCRNFSLSNNAKSRLQNVTRTLIESLSAIQSQGFLSGILQKNPNTSIGLINLKQALNELLDNIDDDYNLLERLSITDIYFRHIQKNNEICSGLEYFDKDTKGNNIAYWLLFLSIFTTNHEQPTRDFAYTCNAPSILQSILKILNTPGGNLAGTLELHIDTENKCLPKSITQYAPSSIINGIIEMATFEAQLIDEFNITNNFNIHNNANTETWINEQFYSELYGKDPLKYINEDILM